MKRHITTQVTWAQTDIKAKRRGRKKQFVFSDTQYDPFRMRKYML